MSNINKMNKFSKAIQNMNQLFSSIDEKKPKKIETLLKNRNLEKEKCENTVLKSDKIESTSLINTHESFIQKKIDIDVNRYINKNVERTHQLEDKEQKIQIDKSIESKNETPKKWQKISTPKIEMKTIIEKAKNEEKLIGFSEEEKKLIDDVANVLKQLILSRPVISSKNESYNQDTQDNIKTIPCRYGQICTNDKCNFAHSLSELRILPCSFGNTCNRFHNSENPCQFLHVNETHIQYFKRTKKDIPKFNQNIKNNISPKKRIDLEHSEKKILGSKCFNPWGCEI